MKIDRWSWSQSKVATACPLQWKLSREDGRTRSLADKPAAHAGLVMDAFCTAFYDGEDPHEEARLADAELGNLDSDLYQEVIRDAEAVLLALSDHPRGIGQVEVTASLEGILVPVRGYADLVCPDQSTVIDYKRGGGYTEEWWQEARMQVAFYGHELDCRFGKIVQVSNGIVKIDSFAISQELVERAHDFLRFGYLLADGDNFASPGRACSYCDYETTCDSSVFARWHGQS